MGEWESRSLGMQKVSRESSRSEEDTIYACTLKPLFVESKLKEILRIILSQFW